ncbi:glyoxalase superfamily protein [Paenibacillus sp. CN-4]|uniref:glyoxalase superfamily protein n=1 Tax=Paenibacillus nanchangensis TaxID=3348343 RepID=UPI00397999C8
MLKQAVPILRMFDEQAAIDFYVGYLGFEVDWEHRFEADFPLYMQVSLGELTIHLSGHHGDCTPGSALRIETADLSGLHAKLTGKPYRYARPQIETTSWETREMKLTDPSGNRLIFYEEL